jgi:putative chitinase
MASENGWEPSHAGPDILEWITVPGTNVRLQLMKGRPSIIMRAYAADYNAFVEPLRDADSAGFTPTNSVATSNHLNGTAMDLNWNDHPFHVSYGGYNQQMIATMREILDFYENTMFWSQDWDSPKDCMHHQMGYDTWNNPRVQDFINRKIRPDGFSTFRRGGTSASPPPTNSVSQADVLARATGISFTKATAILPQVSFALVKANCTNPRRIAAALAQWVIESGHFVYTEEIASGPESEERWKYKGRTWVQLTWLENYRGFSVWCHGLGLVPTPDYFVVRPRELADQKWAALGPAYWWAIKYPRINEYADRGDIDNVSKWVNAPAWVDDPNKHANHEKERRDAYNQALALGDQLLTLTTSVEGDDELSAEAERMIRELYDEYKSNRRAPSRSFFAKDQNWGETPLGFEWNMDGNINEMYMTWGYLLGVSSIEADVEFIAANGVAPASWAGSMVDDTGKRWLSEVGQQWCQGLVALRAAMQKAFRGQPAALTASAPEPQIVYVDRQVPAPLPAPEAAPAPTSGGSTGQVIGRAYDALQELRLADALPIEDRAPLAALIAVLQTKNGSELK